MANKKYVMFDLDDEKLAVLAEVLSNKTSKKIVEYLADKEASEAEIVRDLKLPANTVNYNVKKLIESGLIEVAKDWFWSVKGKKILKYRVANKKILISPKSSKNVVGVLSALLLTGIAAFAIKIYSSVFAVNSVQTSETFNSVSGSAPSVAVGAADGSKIVAQHGVQSVISSLPQLPEIWMWFLLGGVCALIFYMILNWRKL